MVGGLVTAVTLPKTHAQQEVFQPQVQSDLSTKSAVNLTVSGELPFAASGVIEGRIFVEGEVKPLDGALIQISSQTHTGTFSDAEGKFSLKVQDSQEELIILEVSFLGMKPIRYPVTITEKDYYISIPNVILKYDQPAYSEVVVVAGLICYSPPQSLWHKVKWLFRKKHQH